MTQILKVLLIIISIIYFILINLFRLLLNKKFLDFCIERLRFFARVGL